MSTKPHTPSPADRARQYIDDVMKINSKFGMANVASEGAYDAAVTNAAEAFRWVQKSKPEEPQSR